MKTEPRSLRVCQLLLISGLLLALVPAGVFACDGDCNEDGQVTVDELVTGVDLALQGGAERCPAADRDESQSISVDEIIAGINGALTGCPLPTEEFPFCGTATSAVEARINGLLPQMTMAEKLDQMHGSPPQVNELWPTAANERLGIPAFFMVDGPRGARSGEATSFPVGSARGASWDPDLEERVGAAIGEEVRAKGGNVLLAPTINLLRHPRWGRAQETYGEDPWHMGKMGAAFIRGAQEFVVADAKHYALNSIEDTRTRVDVRADERTLREMYLPHFEVAVREGRVGSVMVSYNNVNGQPASASPHLIRDILEGDYGFQGFVVSDWFVSVRNTVPAVTAGTDIEMPAGVFYGSPLTQAVEQGQLPERFINQAVRRILRVKFCFQLDSNPPIIDPTKVGNPEHIQLALDAARAATVLLKNDGALPLDSETTHSIAVVGALAAVANLGDHGSSDVRPTEIVTPLDGIRSHAGEATVTHYIEPLSEEARTAIAAADVAIVVAGTTSDDEGEGGITAGDRKNMALPRSQDDLILDVAQRNPHTVVVLEGGSALLVEPWIEQVSGLLMAWYPGQEGGDAIADILFGNTNPSGHLPITFPKSEADLPPFENAARSVTYDRYHGYRYLDRDQKDPRFPFGFGLSYSNFTYSNLALSAQTLRPSETLMVSFDLANDSARAGAEVVQLYASYEGSSVDRAVRDLKAFTKVELQAGETRRVTLSLSAADLAYYADTASQWRVEPIRYRIGVGSSERNLPLQGELEIVEPPR